MEDGRLYTWNCKNHTDDMISLHEEPILSTLDISDATISPRKPKYIISPLSNNSGGSSSISTPEGPRVLENTPIYTEPSEEIAVLTQEGEIVKQKRYSNGIVCRVVVTSKPQEQVNNDSPLLLDPEENVKDISMGASHFSVLTSKNKGLICVNPHCRCVPWNCDRITLENPTFFHSPNSQPICATSPWIISPCIATNYLDHESKEKNMSRLRKEMVYWKGCEYKDIGDDVLQATGIYVDKMRGYKVKFDVKEIISCGSYVVAISLTNDMWVWRIVEEGAYLTTDIQGFPCMNNVVSCGVSSKKIVTITKEAVHVFLVTEDNTLKEYVEPLKELDELVKTYNTIDVIISTQDILIHATNRKSIDTILASPISSSPNLLSDPFSPLLDPGNCLAVEAKCIREDRDRCFVAKEREQERFRISWWLNLLKLNDLYRIIDHLKNEAHIFGSHRPLCQEDVKKLLREANERIDTALKMLGAEKKTELNTITRGKQSEYIELVKYSAKLQMHKNISYASRLSMEIL